MEKKRKREKKTDNEPTSPKRSKSEIDSDSVAPSESDPEAIEDEFTFPPQKEPSKEPQKEPTRASQESKGITKEPSKEPIAKSEVEPNADIQTGIGRRSLRERPKPKEHELVPESKVKSRHKKREDHDADSDELTVAKGKHQKKFHAPSPNQFSGFSISFQYPASNLQTDEKKINFFRVAEYELEKLFEQMVYDKQITQFQSQIQELQANIRDRDDTIALLRTNSHSFSPEIPKSVEVDVNEMTAAAKTLGSMS